ncbi:hypothetical protein U9M48_015065 [Paspalum notatum var. saurae]|uniref:Uncharacterized protein n=1 Tax=Paspalum notatum var. saurae TaxID=547442 RepID=A0AAQ3T4H1_PASNO
MQEYIEKFTTRPVMHRKKSTPILRSASVSFGDRTPKSTPRFATPINRVIRIEEDKREEKSQLKRKFMEIKSRRRERRFRRRALVGKCHGARMVCPPKHYFEPVTLCSNSKQLSDSAHDPRTPSSVASLGIFSSTVLNRCDRRHPPSSTR